MTARLNAQRAGGSTAAQVHPYNLGLINNLHEILGDNPLVWFLPPKVRDVLFCQGVECSESCNTQICFAWPAMADAICWRLIICCCSIYGWTATLSHVR